MKVIQAVTDAEHRYISTMSNPADLTCCGSNSSTLSNNQLRLHGQAVLSQSDFPDSVPSIQLAAVQAPPEVNSQPKGPEGLMGKTFQQLQAKKKEKLGFNAKVCMFTFSIDASRFSSFEALLHVSVLSFFSSTDLKLSLFYDGEGIIRCRECPKYVGLPERLIHPILVPASSVLATLIIKYSHRQVPHAGARRTLAWTRLHYWIPNERASTKRVIKDC